MPNLGTICLRGGKTGDAIQFEIWTMGSNFEAKPAVYVVVQLSSFQKSDNVMHINFTDNLKNCLANHQDWNDWIKNGADHILVLNDPEHQNPMVVLDDVVTFYMTDNY